MTGENDGRSYNVIIAGASFAGLALARALRRRRVLLVDRQPIGAGQTSACGAPLSVLAAMGAEGSLLQRHDALWIHTPRASVEWPLPEPFCVFDYARFCHDALRSTGAEVEVAAVRGADGGAVVTPRGAVRGRFLADCTGWRAALVRGRRPSYRPRWTAFGIETELPHAMPPGLHFYFVPEVRAGYAWAFPAGGAVRFGVLSYLGDTKLMPALERFLDRFGLAPGPIHGGFLGAGLADPVVDGVFVVGDAAGQCLPLTGEGIRGAVHAGFVCGGLLEEVLDGRRGVPEAQAAYRRFVRTQRRRYRGLLWGNVLAIGLPIRAIGAAARVLGRPGPLRWFLRHYLGMFSPPRALSPRPAVAEVSPR
ncbi:MAG: hypothetical protein HY660_13810 [Armatimonadetes bacterium]|nr:hypothetical protein [Armatimonadota bacterium]